MHGLCIYFQVMKQIQYSERNLKVVGTNNSTINTESSMSGSESGKLEKEKHEVATAYAYEDGRRLRNITDLIQPCNLKAGHNR